MDVKKKREIVSKLTKDQDFIIKNDLSLKKNISVAKPVLSRRGMSMFGVLEEFFSDRFYVLIKDKVNHYLNQINSYDESVHNKERHEGVNKYKFVPQIQIEIGEIMLYFGIQFQLDLGIHDTILEATKKNKKVLSKRRYDLISRCLNLDNNDIEDLARLLSDISFDKIDNVTIAALDETSYSYQLHSDKKQI
ncbi:hypothetical protein ACTFIW_005131 [Dictyostelium discoideum]